MSLELHDKISVAVDACLAACHGNPNERAAFDALLTQYAAAPGWTRSDLFELRRLCMSEMIDTIEARYRAATIEKKRRAK